MGFESMVSYAKRLVSLLGLPEELVDVRIFWFGLVGAIGTGINTSVLWFLKSFIGVNYVLSGFIGIEAAVFSIYWMNNRFTFSPFSKSGKDFFRGALRSNLIRMGGISIQLGVLFLLVELFSIYYLLANFLGVLTAFLFNYLFESLFNWRVHD